MVTPMTNTCHSKKRCVLLLLVVAFVTIPAFANFKSKDKILLKAIKNDAKGYIDY